MGAAAVQLGHHTALAVAEGFGMLAAFHPGPGGAQVLYIGGLGRSGSTLLDRMLGQVPGLQSLARATAAPRSISRRAGA